MNMAYESWNTFVSDILKCMIESAKALLTRNWGENTFASGCIMTEGANRTKRELHTSRRCGSENGAFDILGNIAGRAPWRICASHSLARFHSLRIPLTTRNTNEKDFLRGHMRPFKHVGHHPQFEHIRHPPAGYEFVSGGKPRINMPARVVRSIAELTWAATKNGSTVTALAKFIRSRSLGAQLAVPSDVSLAFLPSMPFILGQIPWVIEIEDTTTVFVPFPRIGGKTTRPATLRDRRYLRLWFSSGDQGFAAVGELSRNYHSRQVYGR